MKQSASLPLFAGALLAAACITTPCHAKDKFEDTAVVAPGSVSSIDPMEEAHKIRQLVKLALANDASPTSRQVLSDEIAVVEKNRKLKEAVVTRLLQDDSPDATLPSVALVRYKDGAVRGLLFTQTDAVHTGNPNRLAWPLDSKREQKEQTR